MDTPRIGKIARLPLEIREQLNQRLADNEPTDELLAWLNALPAVQQILKKLFAGQPIKQQNLSAWKLGGYQDWERAQEVRSRARASLEEAAQLRAEMEDNGADCGSLLDRVGDRVALALLELFREIESSEKGPERTSNMLEIARELTRFWRADHQRQRTVIMEERWDEEFDRLRIFAPKRSVP